MNSSSAPIFESLLQSPDLWERLRAERRAIVLYGMGNGADKILQVCGERGIPVSGVFASDEFVRGQSFHGFPVTRWEDVKMRYGVENTLVLVAFATSRPEVLANIRRIAAEVPLLIPDVPAFGEGLFDRSFFAAHLPELSAARELLCDEESRRIFDRILCYKLTGDPAPLLEAVSDPDEIRKNVLHPDRIRIAADLGAYTGDTVRELASVAPRLERVYAMEPDGRNARKLASYAAEESRFSVIPIQAAAWDCDTVLQFDDSGNRNASALQNRSSVLSARPGKLRQVRALPLDQVTGQDPVDYIKYDVEGSEREALFGSCETIRRSRPVLLVSVYHRTEDLFALPLLVHDQFPFYNRFYLRRAPGIPAWDLNLYAVCDERRPVWEKS